MANEPADERFDHVQTWIATHRVEVHLTSVHDRLEALSTEECLTYLRQGGVGRVAFTTHGLAIVLPVNFTVHDNAIVFLTSSGTKLRAIQAGVTLTFEIDHIGADGVGWSVLAAGPASSTSDLAIIGQFRVLGIQPPPMLSQPIHAVSLEICAVTGRRFGATNHRPLRPGEP